jgi:hypothetical protein
MLSRLLLLDPFITRWSLSTGPRGSSFFIEQQRAGCHLAASLPLAVNDTRCCTDRSELSPYALARQTAQQDATQLHWMHQA